MRKERRRKDRIARNKITGVDDLQFFINHFYEEQSEWRVSENDNSRTERYNFKGRRGLLC